MSNRLSFSIAASWVLVAGGADGAETATISIYTTVLPVCRFAASIGSDATRIPLDRAQGSATGAVTYQCTSGVAPTFAITASAGCPGCGDETPSAPVIVSYSHAIGRGMGSGRELTLVVAGPAPTESVRTALSNVSVTVSP